MKVTVLYIKEYPTEIGSAIARILKDLQYTLTGTMQPDLIWELAVREADPHTLVLLECAVSEYVIRGSYTVELDDTEAQETSYYIHRLLANSRGIDVSVGKE